MAFGILTNRHPESIPKRCGDCNFCSDAEPIFVEKVGLHISFRCNHPHPMAKDWKGRRTGVDPDQAPEQMFCPLLNGIGKGFDLLRPKLTTHEYAKNLHTATQAAKNQGFVEAQLQQVQPVQSSDHTPLVLPTPTTQHNNN